MSNINWDFVKSIDRVISKLSYEDMLKAQSKRWKVGNKISPYRLSQNTIYILETKNKYVNGEITEEEAKAILLRQKLCGNVI